jgi:hypothetical protein
MKFIHTLAFLLLIGYIICDACEDVTDPSVDNCKKITIADHHCCYFEAPKDTNEPKGCASYTNYQYDNIKTLVKYAKTFGGTDGKTEDKDVKIDCKSFYLQISSFILILLLL